MRGNKILERFTVQDFNTPHSCDYRYNRDRTLSHEDIIHYQKIVVALQQNFKIMTEIDPLIPSFPIQ